MCLLFGSKRTDPKCLTSLTVAPCTRDLTGKLRTLLVHCYLHCPQEMVENMEEEACEAATQTTVCYRSPQRIVWPTCVLCALCVRVCVYRDARTRDTRRVSAPTPSPSKKIPHRRMQYVKSLVLVISMPFVLDYALLHLLFLFFFSFSFCRFLHKPATTERERGPWRLQTTN